MSKPIKCPICGTPFTPEKNQKPAWWAVDWCTQDSGLLCPECHKTALALNCVSRRPLPLGVCPFKSDIAENSNNVSEKEYKKLRKKESVYKWLEENS